MSAIDLTLRWWSVAAFYRFDNTISLHERGSSSGGNYVIIGTMALHDAVVMGGGPCLFDGGFWPEEMGFTPPPCATDVTAQLKIKEGDLEIRGSEIHVDSRTGRFVQTVRITNVSHHTIRGPLSFVLDRLSRNVTLRGGFAFPGESDLSHPKALTGAVIRD